MKNEETAEKDGTGAETLETRWAKIDWIDSLRLKELGWTVEQRRRHWLRTRLGEGRKRGRGLFTRSMGGILSDHGCLIW